MFRFDVSFFSCHGGALEEFFARIVSRLSLCAFTASIAACSSSIADGYR